MGCRDRLASDSPKLDCFEAVRCGSPGNAVSSAASGGGGPAAATLLGLLLDLDVLLAGAPDRLAATDFTADDGALHGLGFLVCFSRREPKELLTVLTEELSEQLPACEPCERS